MNLNSTPAWDGLIADLERHIPDMVEQYLQELSERALYTSNLVDEADLWDAAERTFELHITRLKGVREPSKFAANLGQRRAVQGVPADVLLEAVRIDFKILWRKLNELAPRELHALLAQNVEFILSVVDLNVSEVHNAYLNEAALLQSDFQLTSDRFFARLFNMVSTDHTLVSEIAEFLGVDPDVRFEVLSIAPGLVEETQKLFASALRTQEAYSYLYRGTLFVFREQRYGEDAWGNILQSLAAIYMRDVPGLAGLPDYARSTLKIHKRIPNINRLATTTTLWGTLSRLSLREYFPNFEGSYLSMFRKSPMEEQERLRETVAVYLSSGSIKRSASLLYCHRNTVLKRLHTFRDVTGLDVTVPSEGALALVLLDL